MVEAEHIYSIFQKNFITLFRSTKDGILETIKRAVIVKSKFTNSLKFSYNIKTDNVLYYIYTLPTILNAHYTLPNRAPEYISDLIEPAIILHKTGIYLYKDNTATILQNQNWPNYNI